MKIRQGVFLAWLVPVLLLSGCAAGQPQIGALEAALAECESDIRIVNNSIDLRITNNESEQDSAACISNALDFDWDALANRFNSGDESFVLAERDLELRASRADDTTVVFSITETSLSEKTSDGGTGGLTLFLLGCIGVGLVIGFFLSKGSNSVSGGTLGGLSVFGVLSLGFPGLLSLTTDSDPVFWSEFNAWGGPTYGGLIIVAKAFTGFLVSAGFASIVMLIVRWRESKEDRNKKFEELTDQLGSAFTKGVDGAVKKALAGFAKSVKSGELSSEIEQSSKAIRGLLSSIEEMKRTVPIKQRSHLETLSQSVIKESIEFQQNIWNASLTSSRQFEMVVGDDVFLEFGYHKDDLAFGESPYDNWRNQYACFDHAGGLIQVRGERLIAGCNIFQISSKTQVEAKQFKDDDLLSLEVKVHDRRWALELNADDVVVDDWTTFTAEVGALVEALKQVQRNLKVVEDQEAARRERKRLETQYVGVNFGDWQAVRPLGNGGFGQVWLGEKKVLEDDGPRQQAAIKVFSRTDFQSLKQFQAEMSSLGQLRHPNIAQLLDNAKEGNTFWFATSFVGEYSLGGFVSEGLAIEQKRLQTYATQLFAALAHAHRRQMVHGDVHPGNLVLTNDQSAIVLIDFGLSAIEGLRTQEALTNLAYRAPELLTEQPLVDVKNDVYSAAVTILTLARGRTPWKSSDLEALITEMKSDAPSLAGLDESFARFIRPLLNRDPAKRPSSAEVFNHLERRGFHPW